LDAPRGCRPQPAVERSPPAPGASLRTAASPQRPGKCTGAGYTVVAPAHPCSLAGAGCRVLRRLPRRHAYSDPSGPRNRTAPWSATDRERMDAECRRRWLPVQTGIGRRVRRLPVSCVPWGPEHPGAFLVPVLAPVAAYPETRAERVRPLPGPWRPASPSHAGVLLLRSRAMRAGPRPAPPGARPMVVVPIVVVPAARLPVPPLRFLSPSDLAEPLRLLHPPGEEEALEPESREMPPLPLRRFEVRDSKPPSPRRASRPVARKRPAPGLEAVPADAIGPGRQRPRAQELADQLLHLPRHADDAGALLRVRRRRPSGRRRRRRKTRRKRRRGRRKVWHDVGRRSHEASRGHLRFCLNQKKSILRRIPPLAPPGPDRAPSPCVSRNPSQT
jgi:hypothetical protein